MCSPRPHVRRSSIGPRGFSLVEVMVVIALIGILAGILLVAVGGATDSAKRARTGSTLESVSAAMDAFRIEHSALPGVVPPRVLSDGSLMTSSQNVLLHLMGGARVSVQVNDSPADAIAEAEYQRYVDSAQSEDGMNAIELELEDPDNTEVLYNVAVRVPRIGEGPLINGKQYAPYLSPKENEINRRADQMASADLSDPANFHPQAKNIGCTLLPDIVDAWGQPVIILRRDRKSGPVLLVDPDDNTPPQFEVAGIDRYLGANSFGLAKTQQRLDPNNQFLGSRIAPTVLGENEERSYWLFLLLTTPAMEWDIDGEHGEPYSGTARGGYMLLSAGADGIFVARQDGPIDPSTGSPDLDYEEEDDRTDHKFLEEFDDVVMYGGS